VAQSLAAGTSNPVVPEELRIDGAVIAPLDAEAIGTLLEETPAPLGEHVPEEDLIELDVPLVDETDEAELPLAEILAEPEEAPPEVVAAPEEAPPEAGAEPEEALPEVGPELEIPLEEPVSPAPPAAPASDATLRRLADAVSHEVRNPLTAIRTFAELLPERYGDRDFRSRFASYVTDGVERVDRVIDALGRLASLGLPERKPVDLSKLLEAALDARRQQIRERHLLVLKELDPARPLALCDEEQMKFAFDVLLDRALEMLPERGDLYLASRRHATGLRGAPSVRVLLRLQTPGRSTATGQGLSPAENSLGLAIAEAVARAQGGSVAIAASDPNETLFLMDLPAEP
jgi:signal transduction histidine kinase